MGELPGGRLVPYHTAADAAKRVAHIDGLRGIAVLAVVCFHAGVPGFGGGFVGVDIFFVISGYLIINHIVDELGRGKFSLSLFYARRGLRLLPPLLVMLAGTTLVAAVVLVSPYEWEWFAISVVTAALSVSNIYFLSKQGYFDIDTFEKPLLHTWSLGVEEQFYLVVPLLLIGCFTLAARFRANPYRVLTVAGIAVFALSFAGSILQTSPTGRNPAFYLTHWRAWEFAVGGAIGFVARRPAAIGRSMPWELAGLAGLGLLLASNVLNAGNDNYPGYMATLPVLGTALAVGTGLAAPRSIASRVLSLPLLTGIGLVSYSWYLWHWPLIAFARMAEFGDPSPTRDMAMALVSLGLAVASYRLVERPARLWRERHDLSQWRWKVAFGSIAAAVGVAIVTGGISAAGYAWTSSNPALATDTSGLVGAAACPPAICGGVTGRRGVLIGDSHADRMSDVLRREAARLGVALETGKQSNTADADFAIFISRWNLYFVDKAAASGEGKYRVDLEARVAELSGGGHRRILIVGPVPEFAYWGANCILRGDRYGYGRDRCAVSRASVELRSRSAVEMLRHLAATFPNTRYVDPLDLFCDTMLCRPVADGIIVMKDRDHLTTPYGADWFYHALRNEFWWVFGGRPAVANPAHRLVAE